MINSNLGPISHRFRDMAIFSVEKRSHFSYAPPFNPEFKKNISLAQNR